MKFDFESLLSAELPEAGIILTPEAKVLHWNRGAEKIFGYTSAESIDRSIFDLTVPTNRQDEERRLIQQTLDVGESTFESLRRRKDGSLVYVDISSKVIRRP